MRREPREAKREHGGIGRALDGSHPNQVTALVDAARVSWEAGRRAHVVHHQALARLQGEGLTEIVDQVLALGWDLHSSSLVYNQTGLNAEVVMFVFVRPDRR